MVFASRVLMITALGVAACGFDAAGSGAADAPGTNDLSEKKEAGADGGVVPPDNHDARVGAPACDPAMDPSCLALPDGWRLVATTPTSGAAPACPQGYGPSSDVVSGPNPHADACDCGACTIATMPTCAGAVQVDYSPNGTGTCGSSSTTQTNNPAGQCGTDMFTGDATNDKKKYTMPGPTGAACAPGAAAAHTDRVDFSERARVCDGNARCSGATCDARVDAPFRACFSKDGDVLCPAGSPEKHLVGSDASFTCAGACACSVTTQTCAPIMNVYSSTNCAGTPLTIPIDATCHLPGFVGAYRSYRVTTTPAATCAAAPGNPTPTNLGLTKTTTVCCR